MAITFGDNISYKGKKPLDSRSIFPTIAEMKSYSENYLPNLAMCQNEEDGKIYVYNKDNESLEATGKWRELSIGSSSSSETSNSSIQVEELPEEVTQEMDGTIYEYIGEDDEDYGYLKGHFYKATYFSEDEGGTWVEINLIDGIKCVSTLPDTDYIGYLVPENSIYLKYNELDNGTPCGTFYKAEGTREAYLLMNEDETLELVYDNKIKEEDFNPTEDLKLVDYTKGSFVSLYETDYNLVDYTFSDDNSYVKTVVINDGSKDITCTILEISGELYSIPMSTAGWKAIELGLENQIINDWSSTPSEEKVPSEKLVYNNIIRGYRKPSSAEGGYSNVFGGLSPYSIPESWWSSYDLYTTDSSNNHRFIFGADSTTNSAIIFYNGSDLTIIIPTGAKVTATTTEGNVMVGTVKQGGMLSATNNTLSFEIEGEPFHNFYGHITIEAYANTLGNIASGVNTLTAGEGTIAAGYSQIALGKYNKIDTDSKYALIIGNGTSDNDRKNAFTIDWNGNVTGGSIGDCVKSYADYYSDADITTDKTSSDSNSTYKTMIKMTGLDVSKIATVDYNFTLVNNGDDTTSSGLNIGSNLSTNGVSLGKAAGAATETFSGHTMFKPTASTMYLYIYSLSTSNTYTSATLNAGAMIKIIQ